MCRACMPPLGILTTRGGMTSHAAVVARGMGRPCVVGAAAVRSISSARRCKPAARLLQRATSSPSTARPGRSSRAACRCASRNCPEDFTRLMRLGRRLPPAESARQCRHAGRRAPGAAPSAPKASGFAAPSICSSRRAASSPMREMILAEDRGGRRKALAKLLPMQRDGLRRAVRDHGGAARDHPPARSAAARVPAA